MFEELFHTLCQVGIFMLCAQMLMHFRPRESYEKYIKFLIGGMVLLQLLIPVMNCLKSGTGSEPILDVNEFTKEFDLRMEEISRRAYEAERLQSSLVQEEANRILEEDHEKTRIEPVEKIEIGVGQ